MQRIRRRTCLRGKHRMQWIKKSFGIAPFGSPAAVGSGRDTNITRVVMVASGTKTKSCRPTDWHGSLRAGRSPKECWSAIDAITAFASIRTIYFWEQTEITAMTRSQREERDTTTHIRGFVPVGMNSRRKTQNRGGSCAQGGTSESAESVSANVIDSAIRKIAPRRNVEAISTAPAPALPRESGAGFLTQR